MNTWIFISIGGMLISLAVLLLSIKSLKRSKEREKNRQKRRSEIHQIEKRMDEISDNKDE